MNNQDYLSYLYLFYWDWSILKPFIICCWWKRWCTV